jgi:flavin-dependent dehydrogenase
VSEVLDVVVVGGGPAGAVTAALLAAAGLRVVLLERTAAPAEKICGEYVGPAAVAALERLGFGDALREVPALPLAGITMVAPDGGAIEPEFVDRSGARVRGLAVSRKDLDETLLREAARRGVDVRFGRTVSALSFSSDGVSLLLREPREGYEREGGIAFSRARLVIGADGRFSTVAHALGFQQSPGPSSGKSRRGVIHAWLRGVAGVRDRGEMHLLADGSYLGLDPLADGRLNAGLVVDAAIVAESSRAQDGAARLLVAAAASPALAQRFAGASIASEVRYLAPMQTRVRKVAGERALLVGDAAGFFDPLTGEGIFLAIASAELAARAAVKALASSRPARFRSALRGYERDHARLVRGKKLLHPLLQRLLRRPALSNFLARRLRPAPAAAERLLAVIANLRGPAALLHPEFWWPLVKRRGSRAAPRVGAAATSSSAAPAEPEVQEVSP